MKTTWNDKLIIGIPQIDDQHKGFFNLFDKYEEMIFDNNIKSSERYDLLVALENYIEEHFITEESIMSFINYPNIREHINQHNIFIEKIKDFKIKYEHENNELVNSIILFMKKWILTHIPMYDIQIKPYFEDYSKNLKK